MAFFSGISGYNYEFSEIPINGSRFEDVYCVYIYAKLYQGFYTPLYIGKTIHLRTRLNEHNDDGVNTSTFIRGVTHILVHTPSARTMQEAETKIENIERDLLLAINTPCNTSLNS